MTVYKSDFLRVLDERGYIHQCSDSASLDAAGLRCRHVPHLVFCAVIEHAIIGRRHYLYYNVLLEIRQPAA